MSKNCVISISGGMDSSTLLLRALKEYDGVTAISFNYGQKHKVELERAASLVQYLNSHLEDGRNWKMKDGVATPPYQPIHHRIITLDGLSDLLHSTLVTGGEEVPEGHYEQENMKETVVPNRNKIFASIVQAVALSVTGRTGKPTDIALGIHAGDHCFSKDMKILTPVGLKTVEELQIGEKVYSFNLEENRWEEDVLTDIIKKNVVENLTRINTRAGFLDVTNEHKVYKLSLGNFHSVYGFEKSIEKVKTSELRVGDFLIQPTNIKKENLPVTLDLKELAESILPKYEKCLTLSEEGGYIWLGGNSDIYKNNKIPRFVKLKPFVELMAWYIAEGWSKKNPYEITSRSSRFSASFCQSLKANLEKVEFIREMLKEGEFPVRHHYSRVLYNGIPKEVTFFISNILSIFLKEAGSHSQVKHIPDWLMSILLQDQELRESFLYVLGIADGYNTETLNKGFCSTSEKLVEQFSFLAQISGYHFSIQKKTKRNLINVTYSKMNQKRALISLGDAKFTEILSLEEVPYRDHVYDLTVEKNHNFCAGSHGALLISNSIYPDCRQEFRDADDQAFRLGNWGAEKVHYFTPYLYTDKLGILQDGEVLCQEFGLDFDEVYSKTLTSYKPIWIRNPWQPSLEELRSGDTGEWYSDIYSGSSVERVLAFIGLGRPDPVKYATQDGPVEWEYVKQEVQRVLEEYKNK